ncbi:hypothetical protein JHW43_002921 [Diplocarpon mali]|nr:hypothetical protein JHW43_002921 [Diplocarpon mali]
MSIPRACYSASEFQLRDTLDLWFIINVFEYLARILPEKTCLQHHHPASIAPPRATFQAYRLPSKRSLSPPQRNNLPPRRWWWTFPTPIFPLPRRQFRCVAVLAVAAFETGADTIPAMIETWYVEVEALFLA